MVNLVKTALELSMISIQDPATRETITVLWLPQ